MPERGDFLSQFHPHRPPRPPAVGTMGTLGGLTGEICKFSNFGSGRFFPSCLNKARSQAKLKSHTRFLEVGGINLHLVSFCGAIFIHGVVLYKAGCLAFSSIIGCNRRLHDPVSMGVKSSRIWTAHPSCAGAPRYVVWILVTAVIFRRMAIGAEHRSTCCSPVPRYNKYPRRLSVSVLISSLRLILA